MVAVIAGCDAVVEAAGGAFDASLNAYGVGRHPVCTVQVDAWVYAVAVDDFTIRRYSLDAWLDRSDSEAAAERLDADTAREAWELLRFICADTLL